MNTACHIDEFRLNFESDKHWLARKLFINKHIDNYEAHEIDQLLSLSMVWVNHVYLGCRLDGFELLSFSFNPVLFSLHILKELMVRLKVF